MTTLGALKNICDGRHKVDFSGLKQLIIDEADVYFDDDDSNNQLNFFFDKVKGV
jgi:hypothetical protein